MIATLLNRLRHEIYHPFFLGLAFLCIPFYRVLFYSDRVLLFRDLVRDYLPQKILWANAFRAGDVFPYWNHFSFGGTPFWAMNVGSPLHPLNFLFLLFPQGEEARALVYFLFIHYCLFHWGCYRLFRKLQLQSWSATLFSLSLASSGLSLSLHSLGHVLVSMVTIPWFFYFYLRWIQKRDHNLSVFLLGASMAWPVYGGDPQIAYFLALFFLFSLLFWTLKRREIWFHNLKFIFLVGLSAILFSSAQLFPTAELALQSARTSVSISDLVLFSFHPIRILEFFFPLFFGNRLGFETYWAEQWVNFPYKNPFVFSVYPGIFIVWALISSAFQKQRHTVTQWLLLSVSTFFLLMSFGDFSPLPIYHFFAQYLPLFPLFRYPERLLLWTIILFTIYAAVRMPQANWQPIPRKWLILFGLFCGLLAGTFFGGWISVPLTATIGVFSTCLGLFAINEIQIRWKDKHILFLLIIGLIGIDLIWNQTYLVWDMNKHILDAERIPIVKKIQSDKETRSQEISAGASQRVSPDVFSPIKHANTYMDHVTSTTHGILDSVSPNVLTIYGLEDISGYFSLISSHRIDFWNQILAQGDPRHYFDIMGAYYIPRRNLLQIPELGKNHTAQPYIFIPETVFSVKSTGEIFSTIRSSDFQTSRDIVIRSDLAERSNANKPEGFNQSIWNRFRLNRMDQKFERGNIAIKKRDGKRIHFLHFNNEDSENENGKFLQLNESYDKHWKAKVNGEATQIFEANGWAMAIWLAPTNSKSMEIEFEYKNPWISIGLWLTSIWFFAFFLSISLSANLVLLPRWIFRQFAR